MDIEATQNLIDLTADIVSAHVSHNNVAAADLPGLIATIHAALSKIDQPVAPEAPKAEPAVAVRSSVKHDYIVCLEDGKKLKMLKRYLRTNYSMTPEDYRAKWSLPRDYPMVAPAYAEQRRKLAQKIGLGRKKPADAVAPLKVAKPAAKVVKAPAAKVVKAAKAPVAKVAKTVAPKTAKTAAPAVAAPAAAKVAKPKKTPVAKTAKVAALAVAAPVAVKVAKGKATAPKPVKAAPKTKLKVAGPKA